MATASTPPPTTTTTEWSYHSSSKLASLFTHRHRQNDDDPSRRNRNRNRRRRRIKTQDHDDPETNHDDVAASSTRKTGNKGFEERIRQQRKNKESATKSERNVKNDEGADDNDANSQNFLFNFDVGTQNQTTSEGKQCENDEFVFGFDVVNPQQPPNPSTMQHHGVASKKKRKKKKKKKKGTKSNDSNIEMNGLLHEPESSVHEVIDSNAKKDNDQVDTHLASSSCHTTKLNAEKFTPDIRKDYHHPSPPKTAPKSTTPIQTKSTPHQFERTPKKPSAKPTPFQFERTTPQKGYAMVNRQSMGVHRQKKQQQEGVLQLQGKLHTQAKDNPFTFGFSGILPPTPTSGG